ncbi:hypothetical protein [Azospirillum sp. SYSU D00513]|uniref:hypothetical protein n=1 Tax=Azospirillum sp. SYSU D00513 TaxID=2812561 RepID=UPI001A97BBD3|nr:hypothetical protein [Azospirillum sp. SYSU D00513]
MTTFTAETPVPETPAANAGSTASLVPEFLATLQRLQELMREEIELALSASEGSLREVIAEKLALVAKVEHLSVAMRGSGAAADRATVEAAWYAFQASVEDNRLRVRGVIDSITSSVRLALDHMKQEGWGYGPDALDASSTLFSGQKV